MPVEIEIAPENLEQLTAELGYEAWGKATNEAFTRIRQWSERELNSRVASYNSRDTGAYANGWRYEQDRDSLVVYNVAPHAIFVEMGRKPGKPPPVDAIRSWAARKLGRPDLAYPIARAIGRRGLPPRPALYDPAFRMAAAYKAEEYMQEAFDKYLKRAGSRVRAKGRVR